MLRKITLFLLLFISMNSISRAQVRDTATIHLLPYTDTTCIGSQLEFWATLSSDTFSTVTYQWYTNSYPTGVTLDTFYTTAMNDGDSAYCVIHFVNSFGVNDTDTSNVIYIHRAISIPPRVLVSLTTGSNPDCAGHPLTFTAYPVNGGSNPRYQWYINGTEVSGSDSVSFTRIFGGADTVSCRMISNSTCAPFDTVYSVLIPIIHIHLTQNITISAVHDTTCAHGVDSLQAVVVDYGTGVTYQWFVNGIPQFGAVNQNYYTDSINDGDSVYCVSYTSDSCVLNPTDTSNGFIVHRIRLINNSAYMRIMRGSNPGCFDSTMTLQAVIDSCGSAAHIEWSINNVPDAVDSTTISRYFVNHDRVSFYVHPAPGCYVHDTIRVPEMVILRDSSSTIATGILSLIGNALIVSNHGTFQWYYSDINNYHTSTGIDSIVPGIDSATYHPTHLGYYYCKKISNNCPMLPTNIIYISLLDVNKVEMPNVQISPNPTSGEVFMNWGDVHNQVSIDVFDVVGRNLKHEVINNASSGKTDLSMLAAGSYFIVLRNENGAYSSHKIQVEK